jgi:serine/threonine-protein kinase
MPDPGVVIISIGSVVVSATVVRRYFEYKMRQLEVGSKRADPERLAAADAKRLEAVECEKKLLEERVRNLESIVCSVDVELNARLARLAQSTRAAALPDPARQPTVRAADPAVTPIVPGKVLLGRYHVERELGRGGMGAVFLARDAQLGELVALKVVSAHLGGDALEAAVRFRREAQAARKVTHPNVIRIHDIAEDADSGELLLSMEYFAGLTLAELLRRRGPLPLEEARVILGQICDGLGAAHAAAVIHRDLKPGNVLVGEGQTVKIIDFGLAKTAFLAGMTATGLILGTPEYMAPEQIRGRPVDARTDLYSLAAIAYHIVTGRPPFGGESPIAVGFAHCTEPVVEPAVVRPEVPRATSAAITSGLAKEPRDRPATVAAFREQLLQ